jgi:hypothetical protein
MRRKNFIRLGGFLAGGLIVCGAWALVQAQTAKNESNRAQGARQSSDAAGNFDRLTGTKAGSRPQPRGASVDQYTQQMMSSMSSAMGSLGGDDPEMAQLAEAEGELARSSEDLLGQYAATDNADEQKRIRAELRDALAKQFDVQRQRRELELARVEERIKKVREQLKKRNDARDTIVDRRLDQLINDAEGLGWTGPGGTSGRSGAGDLYRNDFQNRPAASPARRN